MEDLHQSFLRIEGAQHISEEIRYFRCNICISRDESQERD